MDTRLLDECTICGELEYTSLVYITNKPVCDKCITVLINKKLHIADKEAKE
jgi:hypothetical protein